MAQCNYKVNEPIKVLYQAPNKQSGLTDIVGEIYLPNGSKDSNFPDLFFTERGFSGTYISEFTPNALGEWQVIVHLNDGSGQVTKQYSVGSYDVTGVGIAVEDVEDKVDIIDSTLDGVDIQVDNIDTKVDNAQIKLNTVDGKVDVLDAKVDALDVKVSSLDTPPMIS